MKSHWRKLAAILPGAIEKRIYQNYFKSEHEKWLAKGEPAPLSHLEKQKLIKSLAAQHHIELLIETGTYMGDMVFAMQNTFRRIISIELSDYFYQKAKARFKGQKKVELLNGDSGKVLHDIAPSLLEPALFWLDGHYSGGKTAKGDKECPIYGELEAILNSPFPHVLLIDDARLFVGQKDYPTIDALKSFVLSKRAAADFSQSGDVMIFKLS